MDTVSVSELKARLSEHLRRVRAGRTVLVTDRGRAVAVLAPVREVAAADARLQDLVDTGLIRPGKGAISPDFWNLPRPQDPEGAVLEALLQEREGGW